MVPRSSGQASYILERRQCRWLAPTQFGRPSVGRLLRSFIQQNPATTPGCRAVSVVVATKLAARSRRSLGPRLGSNAARTSGSIMVAQMTKSHGFKHSERLGCSRHQACRRQPMPLRAASSIFAPRRASESPFANARPGFLGAATLPRQSSSRSALGRKLGQHRWLVGAELGSSIANPPHRAAPPRRERVCCEQRMDRE